MIFYTPYRAEASQPWYAGCVQLSAIRLGFGKTCMPHMTIWDRRMHGLAIGEEEWSNDKADGSTIWTQLSECTESIYLTVVFAHLVWFRKEGLNHDGSSLKAGIYWLQGSIDSAGNLNSDGRRSLSLCWKGVSKQNYYGWLNIEKYKLLWHG